MVEVGRSERERACLRGIWFRIILQQTDAKMLPASVEKLKVEFVVVEEINSFLLY